MTPPVLPLIIAGPAIIKLGGYSYYPQTEIKNDFTRETIKISTDFDGVIDERQKAQMTKISFTPVGMLSSAGIAAMYPYPIGAIGKSVFGTSDAPLVIVTKFGGAGNTGQTITFPRAALTKLPQLRLHSGRTLFGDIEFTCLGDPTVQPNTAGQWNTIADIAFADTTFDETQIVTDIYTAAYGSSPYAAVGSMAGFEVDINMTLSSIYADDYGLVDMYLKDMVATCKFAPSNLTEANFYALLNAHGTNYVYPGQSLSKLNTNLVMTGSGNGSHILTATINNAGPKQCQSVYSTDKHRLTGLEFTSKRTWTAGVANPLFTLAVA